MVQAGIVDFLVTVAYMLLGGFFIRTLSGKYPDSPWSKALAFML